MKLFAYYLPQFHCIPENDKWWGKGFTEWVNVRNARPLFKGHIQPKVPLDNNYYSLDNVNTLKWQANLLQKYKVDGLIFYHYYFSGKKILEKPAEILLRNTDIKMPFFFCWANHNWKRTWEGSSEVLIQQSYDGEKEWEDHFNYLLPFFKDKRYEKRNNKPLFLIYDRNIPNKKEMFAFFDRKCKENGFNGICIIETCSNTNACIDMDSELVHLREPSCAQNFFSSHHMLASIIHKAERFLNRLNVGLVVRYNGNKLYDLMCAEYTRDKKIIRGMFFEWDNTPRHSYRGYVISPVDKKHFLKYARLVEKDEYVFVNAWNEWAEGMMLEPTEQNGYRYLEWIKEWREK